MEAAAPAEWQNRFVHKQASHSVLCAHYESRQCYAPYRGRSRALCAIVIIDYE